MDSLWLFSSGPVGKPSRKLVQKMGQDPVDLPDLLAATHAREHRMFAGTIERKHLSLPQRTALTAFRGLECDFRDWTDIKTWAAGIADALRPGSEEPAPVTAGDREPGVRVGVPWAYDPPHFTLLRSLDAYA